MQDSKSTLWFSRNSSSTHINTSDTAATSSKSSVIKRTQKERDQEANANSGRNLSKQNNW
jgi:hypothetical protein